MTVNKTIIRLLGFTLTALLAGQSPSSIAADGEALYVDEGCVYCHGEAGREPVWDRFPRLDGQSSDYLVQQIKDIQSGARDNGLAGNMMRPAILTLTEEEMEAISGYLSQQ